MTGNLLKSGLTLAAIAAICTAAVAATYQLTRERIVANEQAFLEQSLERPPAEGDFAVYAEGAPAAALFAVTARDGYSGPIRILVGIREDGTITGVRILEHRETPGLGDKIESSRSDWVFQFDGRSIGDPGIDDWAIRRDGGQFDQLSGASVTPRAVTGAIRDTLLYFDANREEIFAAPATEDES